MDNVISYLNFRKDIPFSYSKFNEVDAMILSLLTSIDFGASFDSKVGIKELYTDYEKTHKPFAAAHNKDERKAEKLKIFKLVSESERFNKLILEKYEKSIDETTEKTFYGAVFSFGTRHKYVVYRGTDGSLVSWKENFNTLYEMPTAGQYQALDFLQKVLVKPFCKCTVIGHSKGGNLAVYASIFSEEKLQKKIDRVYAFDAPGFIQDISNKLGYLRIKDRISAYVPESAVIGNLLRPPFDKKVVAAEGKGAYQHDLINWNVGATEFVYKDATNEFSKSVSKKVNDWIDGIAMGDRERVVDELFSVFRNNGINHITDLIHVDIWKIIGIIKAATSLSAENRALLGIIIKEIRN